jgi:hypothetical protein
MQRRRLAGYSQQHTAVQSQLDTLRVHLDRLTDLLRSKPGLTSLDVERLREKGLESPVADIRASLEEKKDLIPYEGVMGGTMDFYEIHVLTSKWVLAYFEDGHVGGYMLLEYDVSQRGDISWRFIRAHLN